MQMPILGFGTWQMQGAEATQAVKAALDMGYRLIDTAEMYGNEAAVGEGIRQSAVPREEIFVTTKLLESNHDVTAGTRRQLELLGLDYLDLLLIHWPPDEGAGEEIWQQFITMQRAGLARAIGVSNYSIRQIDRLRAVTGVVPALNQVKWSPFGFNLELLEYCQRNDIVLESYSPLTRGERLQDERLQKLSEKHHKTPAQIILRWNIERGIVVIPKASSPEHLRENLDIFDFSLTPEDMQLLDSCNEA